MATIRASKRSVPLKISNFYGLNMTGDTQLDIGESSNMNNCYITENYDLSKMYGYKQLMTQVANKRVQGMWYGDINGTMYFIFAINGKLYKFNSTLWDTDFTGNDVWSTVTTEIGSLTDAPTQFFAFGGKLYILNGYEYKSYDGINLVDVVGYTPKLRIGCKPATGIGTEFEAVNVLNGKRHMTYNADGTTMYQLAETNVGSIDSVYVDGVLKTLTTHYTVDLTNGRVNFVTAPTSGLDNVDIYWTKGTRTREYITKNRFAFLFGLASDTRVFLYGNPDGQNLRVHSSLANGVPSVEYFEEANVEPIGSASYPITGMARQNNIMLVFKTNETYYSYYDSVNLDGTDIVTFPTPIINDTRGNMAMGQVRVLANDPFTFDKQFLKWYPTQNKDERNMKDMGLRIQEDLTRLNIEDMLTIDKENTNEMWFSNGKKVWIYRYDLSNPKKEQGVFSRLDFPDTPSCWLVVNGVLYFGTTEGKIMKLSDDYLTYNGTTIESHWEMNMFDFGARYVKKTLNKSWITLEAQPEVSLDIQFVTDKNAYSTPVTVSYMVTTFDNVDFGNFTFLTNYNPQTKYIRLKAKKWNLLKAVIDNTSDATFVVLELNLKAEYGGESK